MIDIIGLRELREHTEKYIRAVRRGRTFMVVRRSRPVFAISPPRGNDGRWEAVVDLTKLEYGGYPAEKVFAALRTTSKHG